MNNLIFSACVLLLAGCSAAAQDQSYAVSGLEQ